MVWRPKWTVYWKPLENDKILIEMETMTITFFYKEKRVSFFLKKKNMWVTLRIGYGNMSFSVFWSFDAAKIWSSVLLWMTKTPLLRPQTQGPWYSLQISSRARRPHHTGRSRPLNVSFLHLLGGDIISWLIWAADGLRRLKARWP